MRETTLAQQKKLGIVPEDCQLTARSEGIPAWTDLTDDERKVATRLMEIYAGFAEHTDYHAGLFLDALEGMDVLDNTACSTLPATTAPGRRPDNRHTQRNAHYQLCGGHGREHVAH